MPRRQAIAQWRILTQGWIILRFASSRPAAGKPCPGWLHETLMKKRARKPTDPIPPRALAAPPARPRKPRVPLRRDGPPDARLIIVPAELRTKCEKSLFCGIWSRRPSVTTPTPRATLSAGAKPWTSTFSSTAPTAKAGPGSAAVPGVSLRTRPSWSRGIPHTATGHRANGPGVFTGFTSRDCGLTITPNF